MLSAVVVVIVDVLLVLVWVVGSWEVHVAEEMRGGLRVVLVEAERVGRHWVCTDLSTRENMSNRLLDIEGG